MAKIQRLIMDAPIGMCVGFELTPEDLEAIGAEADEWELHGDSGGEEDVCCVLDTGGNDVEIRPMPTQAELYRNITPIGPDMHIWRDKAPLRELLREVYEVELP